MKSPAADGRKYFSAGIHPGRYSCGRTGGGVNALAALGSVLLLIFFYERNLRRLLLQTAEKTGEDL